MKWFLLLLAVPVALACVVPQDGMVVSDSVSFCSDVYYFDKGISVLGDNIKIFCDGAVFKSWKGGKGISIEHSKNITVKGCRFLSYDIGMYVRNSSRIFLEDNHLVRNRVGTRFVVVEDSATFNHDVSLGSPFEILESEHNVLSLTNKVVSGSFCDVNFCNQQRNSVELFAAPKTELASWFVEKLGIKSPERLREWVFSGLVV